MATANRIQIPAVWIRNIKGRSSIKQPANEIPTPIAVPMPLPIREMRNDSTINSRKMADRVAPIDFLIPISLVRSCTDTSITVIMDSPATIREMAAMAVRSQVTMSKIPSNFSFWFTIFSIRMEFCRPFCRSRAVLRLFTAATESASSERLTKI